MGGRLRSTPDSKPLKSRDSSPEREARRLLGLFEEVERMMENYLRAQAKAEAAQGPQARSAWKPTAQDEFKRLSESKAPRPRRDA